MRLYDLRKYLFESKKKYKVIPRRLRISARLLSEIDEDILQDYLSRKRLFEKHFDAPYRMGQPKSLKPGDYIYGAKIELAEDGVVEFLPDQSAVNCTKAS